MKPKKLPRSFFNRPADQVAPDLLGFHLCHQLGSKVIKSRIVETEAYVGVEDKACHAFKGRTPRTEVMFGPPGHAYVYLVYGMHELFNIVTAEKGLAHAVLIRAGEPVGDHSLNLSGPGRFTKALKISRSHNQADLTRLPLYVEEAEPAKSIKVSQRIGVDYAGHWAKRLLRFFDAESSQISGPRHLIAKARPFKLK